MVRPRHCSHLPYRSADFPLPECYFGGGQPQGQLFAVSAWHLQSVDLYNFGVWRDCDILGSGLPSEFNERLCFVL